MAPDVHAQLPDASRASPGPLKRDAGAAMGHSMIWAALSSDNDGIVSARVVDRVGGAAWCTVGQFTDLDPLPA